MRLGILARRGIFFVGIIVGNPRFIIFAVVKGDVGVTDELEGEWRDLKVDQTSFVNLTTKEKGVLRVVASDIESPSAVVSRLRDLAPADDLHLA